MKQRTMIARTAALLLLAMVSLPAAGQTTTLAARSGSKMRIEGTSNIHDWQCESPIIGGKMEVGPNFHLTADNGTFTLPIVDVGSAFDSHLAARPCRQSCRLAGGG